MRLLHVFLSALLFTQCAYAKKKQPWTDRLSVLCQGADEEYYVHEDFELCCPCSSCLGDLYRDRVSTCRDDTKNCISLPGRCVEEKDFKYVFTRTSTTPTTPTTTTNTFLNINTTTEASRNVEIMETVPAEPGMSTAVAIALIVALTVAFIFVCILIGCNRSLRNHVDSCLSKIGKCVLDKPNQAASGASTEEGHTLIDEGARPLNEQPAPGQGHSICEDSSLSGPQALHIVPDVRPRYDDELPSFSNRRDNSYQPRGSLQMRPVTNNQRQHVNDMAVYPRSGGGGGIQIGVAGEGGSVYIHHVYVNGNNPASSQQNQNDIVRQALQPQVDGQFAREQEHQRQQPRSDPPGQSNDTIASRPYILSQNNYARDFRLQQQQSQARYPAPQRQPSENLSTASERTENSAFSSRSDDICGGSCYSEAQPLPGTLGPQRTSRRPHENDSSQNRGAVCQFSQEEDSITIHRPPEADNDGCS